LYLEADRASKVLDNCNYGSRLVHHRMEGRYGSSSLQKWICNRDFGSYSLSISDYSQM